MIGDLNCTECFMREGKHQAADFILNGQSVCQKHTHLTIRERGQAPLAYTWSAPDMEPVLESATWADWGPVGPLDEYRGQ